MSVISELTQSRELLRNLTSREVKGKYKRSVLGQAWSLLNPIASLTIYSLVFGFVLRANPDAGDPSGLEVFVLWLACALLPWNFFSATVTGGMNALLGNAEPDPEGLLPAVGTGGLDDAGRDGHASDSSWWCC